MRIPATCLLSTVLLLSACGHEGEGTLVVTAYGEAFIEDGIPVTAVGDGWAVAFSRFEVVLQDVRVAGALIDVPAKADLSISSSGAGHELGAARVSAGEHTGGGFTLSRVEVEGTATKGSTTKSFRWEFAEPTRYEACETTTTVTDGGSAVFQITLHADHLFYDSLVSPDPNVLFQALADADADGDGVIAPLELAATDIGAYDPGSEDGLDDLWAWLNAQTRTLGHVDGEGHCHAVPAT